MAGFMSWRGANRREQSARPEERLAKFEAARKSADYAQVIALATELLADTGLTKAQRLVVLSARARARLDMADYSGAVVDSDAVLADAPERANQWVDRGAALYYLGRSSAAVESFDKAIALEPIAHTHLWRAFCYHMDHRPAQARAAVEDALRCDPYHVEALQLRAQIRYGQKELEGALEDLTEALNRSRNKKILHRLRGETLADLNQPGAAIADYDVYLRLEPGDTDIRAARAALKRSIGDIAGAIEDYDRLVRTLSDDRSARRNLVELLYETGRRDDALNEATCGVIDSPAFPQSHATYAEALRLCGRLEEAAKAIDEAVRLEPGSADFATQRARILIEGERSDEAHEALSVLIGAFPKREDCRFMRGELHRESGRLWAAIDDFDRLLSRNPKHAGAWLARARTHLALERPHLAMADAKRALKLGPSDALAFVVMGNAHLHLEDADSALAHYQQALVCDPRCREAQVHRAILFVHLGRFRDALDDYDRMAALDPTHGWIKGERGKLRFVLGDFDGAMNDLDIAERAAPRDEDVTLWRYFAYRRAGDAATLMVRSSEGWTAMLQRLIVGEVTEDEFFAIAEDCEHNEEMSSRARAAFLTAELSLLRGETIKAAALFRRAAALAPPAAILMRCAAQAELSRLESRGEA